MQLPLYTAAAAAKWAHLYSPTLWIAHHLDAHRMARTIRNYQCILNHFNHDYQTGNRCVVNDFQLILSTLFIMFTVVRVSPPPLSLN